MHYRLKNTNGFALADIVIISLITLIILSSLLTIASNAFQGVYKDHYQTMAEEAAEAGTAYATSCLWQSDKTQTWGAAKSRPDLTPATDCAGRKVYNDNEYVIQERNIRTRFVVPDLDLAAEYSVQISSTGYTEILDNNGTVRKTYTSILKKVITWEADLESSMSASGANRTCAVLSGKAYCWGYGESGQLGNGDTKNSNTPVKVKQEPGKLAGRTIKQIFAGSSHNCVSTTDNKVYCWGLNDSGQLGNGSTRNSSVPVAVVGLPDGGIIDSIGGGYATSCAVVSGEIYCWGDNSKGTVGSGSRATRVLFPEKVSINGTATKISNDGSSSETICAIVNKRAWCWGDNTTGAIGNGDGYYTIYRTPAEVSTYGVLKDKDITDISVDGQDDIGYYYWNRNQGEHACAIAERRVYCWGSNVYGQLGNRSTSNSSLPVAVYTSGVLRNRDISEVRVGVRHSCALSDNDIFCWGQRSNGGQLGDNNTSPGVSSVPVTVFKEEGRLKDAEIRHISAGMNRGCATTKDGRTFCWGRNREGQIGDGTFDNRPKPTEAIFLRPIANQYIY